MYSECLLTMLNSTATFSDGAVSKYYSSFVSFNYYNLSYLHLILINGHLSSFQSKGWTGLVKAIKEVKENKVPNERRFEMIWFGVGLFEKPKGIHD